MAYDRFEPQSFEDCLSQGRTARECGEIRASLWRAQERRELELEKERHDKQAWEDEEKEAELNLARDEMAKQWRPE